MSLFVDHAQLEVLMERTVHVGVTTKTLYWKTHTFKIIHVIISRSECHVQLVWHGAQRAHLPDTMVRAHTHTSGYAANTNLSG